MIRTSRDIKSSMEIARKNRAMSFTQGIEENLKAELEREHGSLLDKNQETEIIEKERKRMAKQSLALKKSRIKILKMKQKVNLIQNTRREPIRIKSNSNKKLVVLDKKPVFRPNFKKMEIGY